MKKVQVSGARFTFRSVSLVVSLRQACESERVWLQIVRHLTFDTLRYPYGSPPLTINILPGLQHKKCSSSQMGWLSVSTADAKLLLPREIKFTLITPVVNVKKKKKISVISFSVLLFFREKVKEIWLQNLTIWLFLVCSDLSLWNQFKPGQPSILNCLSCLHKCNERTTECSPAPSYGLIKFNMRAK